MATEDLSDQAMLAAVRRRIMRDIEEQHAQNVINNILGSGGGGVSPPLGDGGGGGQPSPAPGSGIDPEMLDYLIEIEKQAEIDPATGKPTGSWTKKVHRHAEPKGPSALDQFMAKTKKATPEESKKRGKR